jgi:hypothetical protein
MGFRENLLKKIRINELTVRVGGSLGPVGGGSRVDRDAVRELAGMAGFSRVLERDLELWVREGKGRRGTVLVLDNDLPLYAGTVADVALRKSPTVKEMISIRNAVKILDDRDVVVARKGATLEILEKELLEGLDLTWDMDDIRGLVTGLMEFLKAGDRDRVSGELRLLAEVFGFVRPPESLGLAGLDLWGKLARGDREEVLFGPVLVFPPDSCRVLARTQPVSSLDREAILELRALAEGLGGRALKGDALVEFLERQAEALLPGK